MRQVKIPNINYKTDTNLLVSMEKPEFHTGNESCVVKHAFW